MKKLGKHGIFRKQMMKDASENSMVNATMGVPRKILDTKRRQRFRKTMNTLGLISFAITVTIVGIILLFMFYPSVRPSLTSEVKPSSVILPLFFCNLMGMFTTSASDDVVTNWFARAIIVTTVFLTAGFILHSLTL